MSKQAEATEEQDFLTVLEQGVRQVLANKKSSPADKLAAVTAGTKLLAIKHRISGDDTKGFFD